MTRAHALRIFAVAIIALLVTSIAMSADAAQTIAFDSVSTISGTATAITTSHTVTDGDNFLVAGFFVNGSQDITSVTYNGDALTLKSCAATQQTCFYYLFNPDAGTHDLVVNRSSSQTVSGYVASFTGVDESGFDVNGTQNNVGNTTNTSRSVTTLATNAMVVYMSSRFVALSTSDGTERFESTGDGAYLATREATAPASTQITVTSGSSNDTANWIFSLVPAADTADESATSTAEISLEAQAQQNIFNGFVVLFMSMAFMVWVFKKR